VARPIWSGTISFGLVSVPVKMYSATEAKELRFHLLHKDDLAPIGYDKVRQDTGVALMAALREAVERTKRLKRLADGTRKRSTTRKRKAS
jgi:hypothetical protein